ncbi:hypothetical protein QFC20_002416 [Naganishia adeliensis]|uniref:Uncharacterized protein n=1 Tax=Naganishia adeliensis TaxID=92952 RepID=A0ACC2WKS5_9TREE|nr:hypothetical protein QFC20_002416 [Naganishia adeliensis]
MVCKKCEKKITKLATTDPFKASSSKTRTIGENKLLSSKKAARASPYAKSTKCLDCPATVQQTGGSRCHKCAYKKALQSSEDEMGENVSGIEPVERVT